MSCCGGGIAIVCLVVHDEFVLHEVVAIGFGLIRTVDQLLLCMCAERRGVITQHVLDAGKTLIVIPSRPSIIMSI